MAKYSLPMTIIYVLQSLIAVFLPKKERYTTENLKMDQEGLLTPI